MDNAILNVSAQEALVVLNIIKQMRGNLETMTYWRSVTEKMVPAMKSKEDTPVSVSPQDVINIGKTLSTYESYDVNDATVAPGLIAKITQVATKAAEEAQNQQEKDTDGQTEETSESEGSGE